MTNKEKEKRGATKKRKRRTTENGGRGRDGSNSFKDQGQDAYRGRALVKPLLRAAAVVLAGGVAAAAVVLQCRV